MLNSGASGQLPSSSEGHIEFSTSIRMPVESNLSVATAVAQWRQFEGMGDGLWVDGQELARSEVWIYDGPPICWDMDPVEYVGGVLANLEAECDVISEDLHTTAALLVAAHSAGEFAGVECCGITQRWLILDPLSANSVGDGGR